MEEHGDDKKQWWGPFYHNPLDKRFMVPKKFGIGFTPNWANWVWRILFAFSIAGVILLGWLKCK